MHEHIIFEREYNTSGFSGNYTDFAWKRKSQAKRTYRIYWKWDKTRYVNCFYTWGSKYFTKPCPQEGQTLSKAAMETRMRKVKTYYIAPITEKRFDEEFGKACVDNI